MHGGTWLLVGFTLAVWLTAGLDSVEAHSSGPPPGVAGDPPNNQNCTQCHGGGVQTTSQIQINAPTRYVPGQPLNLTVSMSNPQTTRNGFEIIAKRQASPSEVAGSLQAVDSSTQVDGQGYAKHTATGNNQTSWTLSWTPPNAGAGRVTFFSAGNAANDNGTNDTGDRISLATLAIEENLPPSAPSVNTPVNDSIVGEPIILGANVASDGNGDALTYEFQLCADAACLTTLATSPLISTTSTTVAWAPTFDWQENEAYYWRARASDGWVFGSYQAAARFWVNSVPEPPVPPSILEPLEGVAIASTTPTIVLANARDPDPGDQLVYDFLIATDPAFANVVVATSNVVEGANQTTWTVPIPLTDQERYYLLATARDLVGHAVTATAWFDVDASNLPPGAPSNLRPTGTIASQLPVLQADPVTDPEGHPVTYAFWLDTDPTYTSPALRTANGLTLPVWAVPPPTLTENATYRWRIRAFDGKTFGPAAETSFRVNTLNEPPGLPVPLSPLDGSRVSTRFVQLVAQATIDPDGDAVWIVFDLAETSTFSALVAQSPPITVVNGQAIWTFSALQPNRTYYWRAWALDGLRLAGAPSPAFAFAVVNANVPPPAPILPQSMRFDSASAVSLLVQPVIDPDNDPVTLTIEVYADSQLAVPITAAANLAPGQPFKPDIEFTPGAYYWRARANDPYEAGPWSNTASFTIDGPLPFAERPLSTRLVLVHKERNWGCHQADSFADGCWVLGVTLIMLRRRWFLRTAKLTLILALTLACGSDNAQTVRLPRPTDANEVQAIFDRHCIGCHHGGTDTAGGLSLRAEHREQSLLNAQPHNLVARDRGWKRVAPASPETSFILYKLTQPGPGQGERMPLNASPLSDDDVEVIRRWIAAGAR